MKAQATIKVTVTDDTKKKELTGKGLEISADTVSASEDDETISVKVFFDGEDVTSKVTWSSADEDVVSVDEGEILVCEAGKTTLTAKYNDQTVTATVVITPGTEIMDDDEYDDSDDGEDMEEDYSDDDEDDDSDDGDDGDDSDDEEE